MNKRKNNLRLYISLILPAFLSLFLPSAYSMKYASAYILNGEHATSGHKIQSDGLNSAIKKLVLASYMREIPLEFRKYVHFSGFKFSSSLSGAGDAASKYCIRAVINNSGYSGYNTAVVKLLGKNDGKLSGIAYVDFKTEIYAPVAVAARTIGRLEIIGPKDIKISYLRINSLSNKYYLDKKPLEGRESKYVIAQNSALTGTDTERKRVVNFGNTVNIIYRRYGLFLKVKGMALQDGAMGSSIRVKNIESGTIINCVVKSRKSVEAE